MVRATHVGSIEELFSVGKIGYSEWNTKINLGSVVNLVVYGVLYFQNHIAKITNGRKRGHWNGAGYSHRSVIVQEG